MSEHRPDRTAGLIVKNHKADIDIEELTKNIGMVRGVLRVVSLDYRRLMVVFETQQRTSEGEYGPAIRAAVIAMLGPGMWKVDWLEEDFNALSEDSRVRREAFDALLDMAKRVYGPAESLSGTGVEAVELRTRHKIASMIEDTAREILSPKKT